MLVKLVAFGLGFLFFKLFSLLRYLGASRVGRAIAVGVVASRIATKARSRVATRAIAKVPSIKIAA